MTKKVRVGRERRVTTHGTLIFVDRDISWLSCEQYCSLLARKSLKVNWKFEVEDAAACPVDDMKSTLGRKEGRGTGLRKGPPRVHDTQTRRKTTKAGSCNTASRMTGHVRGSPVRWQRCTYEMYEMEQDPIRPRRTPTYSPVMGLAI
jgi:hypothetical protein